MKWNCTKIKIMGSDISLKKCWASSASIMAALRYSYCWSLARYRAFWAIRSFGLYLIFCELWRLESLAPVVIWERNFQSPCTSKGGINACTRLYTIYRVLIRAIFVLLTPRKEHFDKQPSCPEKKAASAGKSVVWRRDQFSQPRSRPIQKVKVWKDNNHKYFPGLSIFLVSISSY